MPDDVVAYYDAIARDYDQDRFGGSYGRYLDAQERRLLERWLAPRRGERILDVGCGTGRFLDLATDGVDPSGEMIEVARDKFPAVHLARASGAHLPYPSASLGAVFSMHVFMHLPYEALREIVAECARVVRPGGLLIFDIPSLLRRRVTGHRQRGWHGATALTSGEVRALAGEEWRVTAMRGLLFLPIQRFGKGIRQVVRPLDTMIGSTPLKYLSSYSLYRLVRV